MRMHGSKAMRRGPREGNAMSSAARCPSHRPGSGPVAAAAPRHRQSWLAREDRTLRACAGIVPVREVAARLGRSRPAVLARARVLGLHWFRPNPGRTHPAHTLGDVARLLGVGTGTAGRWVAAGWLVAVRREVRLGRQALWLVDADDLGRFLRECRPIYDPGRIRDPAWRAFVAALPPERDPWLTPCEAARLLNVTPHGIRKRIATGRLAACRWGGRYYLRRSALAPHPQPS
jgi:excisionase family DNA binding protein